MILTCYQCGTPTDQVMFDDVKNMSKGKALCEKCQKPNDYTEKIQADGTIKGYTIRPLNPFDLITQVNPDIACDFCSKPDPVWLYDLKIEEEMIFGGKKIKLGDRWVVCEECEKEIATNSPIGTILNLGIRGNVTNLMQIHAIVMDSISNKQPYVRSEEDGKVGIENV